MSEANVAPNTANAALQPRRRSGDTAYLDQGAGEAMVFIHGVGLNADAWGLQIAEFSTSHRVIAIDMPGHGESAPVPSTATLDDYVRRLADLLTSLGIATANIIGHSMGGLVAIGFALAYPDKTLRLAVLNSVYKRTPEKRAAVMARALEISASGSAGNIEEPLERWFGSLPHQPGVASRVRQWLAAADPKGYATAYALFAKSDEIFAGRLGELKMPALFATGTADGNSTPAMASAMAIEANRGSALIIDGARHMMNLTHPEAVNEALKILLTETSAAIDIKDLRKAFGSFMTGVTVVTTRDASGNPRGFTANSFSSVSLDPPLLLICISKHAASCDVFTSARSFAVNILAESQKVTSGVFASKSPDKFSGIAWSESDLRNPLLTGSTAWFDCINHQVVNAGDHVILIGRVSSYAHTDASPLGYARGGYFSLGLEQSAVNAAAQVGRTEVGAILECNGKLLVFPTPGDTVDLPHVGRNGEAGSASRLLSFLGSRGITAELGFLYAVFENRDDLSQSIYYRGEAQATGPALLLDFDDLPWSRFRDNATRAMLKRYASERLEGRYKIYSGDHVSGDVKGLSD